MTIYPNGWSKVVTLSGVDGGLGFHCEKCHLVYRHDAPVEVFHCGALDKLDKKWYERLPIVKLESPRPLTVLE